eukprot:c11310_g1_i3.p1 GENE.c11310_g1_i3~~c11310_g1_i3.p1  ORF type:complete len:610 (-),score=118.29 c11310_g1_i3:95-1924(-)
MHLDSPHAARLQFSFCFMSPAEHNEHTFRLQSHTKHAHKTQQIMHAVYPRISCPHADAIQHSEHTSLVLDALEPCVDCGNVGENMLCMDCFQIHCGRHVNQHAVAHFEKANHAVVMGFADLSFWCYACEDYITSAHPCLRPFYTAAHVAKFGELPGSRQHDVQHQQQDDHGASSSSSAAPPNFWTMLEMVVWKPLEILPASYKFFHSQDEHTRYDLCKHSPFERISPALKQSFIAAALLLPMADKAIGCLVGCAVGDSVGAPLEFLPAQDTPATYTCVITEEGATYPKGWGNKFQLLPGQWTDDSSMALCIADSLLCIQAYSGSDIRTRFWSWWFRGYNNAFRKSQTRSGSVGLGGNISQSIFSMEPGVIPTPRFQQNSDDAGNGSLMRLAPIAIFFHGDIEKCRMYARESSLTTHPGAIAREACALMAHIMARAITSDTSNVTIQKFLDEVTLEYLELIKYEPAPEFEIIRRLILSAQSEESLERNWNWKSDSLQLNKTIARRGSFYNGYDVSAGYFGSYSIDGLAMGLHAVYHTSSFTGALEHVVNMLGDCDTTAAIACQIAGAFYGFKAIPQSLLNALNRWDDHDIALRGALLFSMAHANFRTQSK